MYFARTDLRNGRLLPRRWRIPVGVLLAAVIAPTSSDDELTPTRSRGDPSGRRHAVQPMSTSV
jgi:hypothetical protein